MPRVPYQDVYNELLRVLRAEGFAEERATLCARLFADTTRDGVYSHGLNRFPRFMETVRRGVVNVKAEAERQRALGALEQWDGRQGPGNVNAYRCMERAMELAREQGMGGVALRNTNHWMRGGSYGWQAANAGLAGICWTNTMPNLPPWGSRECRLGNNPLVMAVPRRNDRHVVLDMAVSQFSYGAMETYRRRGELLPVAGGFDEEGQLTRDPGAIEASKRPLPIGFWKGSGLSLMLDMLAALLSGGQATHQIPADIHEETDISQFFVAFDLSQLNADAGQMADQIIDHLHQAEPAAEEGGVYYPGEQTRRRREENMAKGLPVDEAVWATIQEM